MKMNGAGSPGVEHNIQAFLEALAAGGGKPMQQMSPKEGGVASPTQLTA